ncbi:MAG: FAD-binding and (Fe-S)-binding domain-containing protein [Chloroflexota bacterium]|nr:FAD-binding and (Fe-S)-binding domain-containing protein [Chloroflexota bacterium]MDE2908434.1 FAD-binding and (Fe-S)-binding domain-containing protein [Chloroflexota bacterium]
MQIDEMLHDLRSAIGHDQAAADRMTRVLYSTDASNYQVMPLAVTFPRDADDVVAVHEIARKYGAPVLPRGGGSALAGQAVGEAVIMDFTRHMRRIRGVNAEARTVDVEPGLILGALNTQLAPLDLMFGPDPASAERAAIGGVIGNNATGAHSIRYGMTADHIARLQVVTASGALVWLDESTAELDRIRATVSDLVAEHKPLIEARYPKTWRTVAGYALDKINPDDVNLNWLLCGSEGTLATVARAELRLVERPKIENTRLALVHFDTLRASLEATPRILELAPAAIELMDKFLLDKTRAAAGYRDRLTFVEGDPEAILVVEFVGSERELGAKINDLKAHVARLGFKGVVTIAETPAQQNDVWTVRKAGLGLMMSERSEAKPVSFIEDGAVPVESLADYISDVERIIHDNDTTYAIYAHASAGCLHIRPLINLKTLKGRDQYRSIADAVARTVKKHQGTITGEHGQGLVRGEFSEYLFGPELMDAFRVVKRAFDPDNMMNPGKIIDSPPMDSADLLRYSPDYGVIQVNTRYDWSSDNGFAGAVEMCNGAGVCRKEGAGTMCPSYQATLDEAHSTRGRANALRAAISGVLPEDLGDPAVKSVLDLCLGCKACAAECPSSVDVAKLKSEFLATWHDRHGLDFATRVFGNIHRVNQLAGALPKLSNLVMNNALGRAGAGLLGLPTERPLPKFAERRFSSERYPQYDAPDAVLIIDTFTEWNHPEVGRAAMQLAETLGLRLNVECLPGQACCGRPAISKGLLDSAKRMAHDNVLGLGRAQQDAPYIFVEPSCLSAFTDDYLTLVDRGIQEAAKSLAQRCLSAEAFFAEKLAERADALAWKTDEARILLHGHCHQKALWGTADTLKLLRAIPGADVAEMNTGCCGVAGSFGYEHYELSMKIAEDRLLPAIRANPDAAIAAPGTSCRAQIGDAGFGARHPIEIVLDALDDC